MASLPLYAPRTLRGGGRGRFPGALGPPLQTPALSNYSERVEPCPSIFRLRQRSLIRGIALALGALAASLRLAGFPHLDAPHTSRWQILAVLAACCGMAETARCLRRRWSLYHAGVLILLYSELMIVALSLFFWLYPL